MKKGEATVMDETCVNCGDAGHGSINQSFIPTLTHFQYYMYVYITIQ